MNEAELLEHAAKLGQRAVDQLDAERMAVAVTARLEAAPPASSVWRSRTRFWVAGLAAAAALLLALRLTLGGPATPPPSHDAAAPAFLTELDELSPAELEVVLQTLAPASAATLHPDGTAYDELDTKSLELLLRSLEG